MVREQRRWHKRASAARVQSAWCAAFESRSEAHSLDVFTGLACDGPSNKNVPTAIGHISWLPHPIAHNSYMFADVALPKNFSHLVPIIKPLFAT